ncbi:type II toxin-antitoxin system VapC family toxin [Candidatus Poribacteria bacterium]|nr:type II toxin-antitoxin system VapC family toxin [Candidatus Poribacteria bacterium]MYK24917.1 type II toxin-antitoxin system VapC family toxin [Candidatus Poribacteria bacterium]
MNEVFVDTSGWASFFMKKDPYHAKALRLMAQWQQQNRRVVTINYVLTELIALFTRDRVPRSTALDYIETIRSADWVEIVHIDESLDEKAWQLLENRLDKEWSLVDAASFVVMQDSGITEALATDHHFEQARFVYLLK